jgi:phenylacetate-CoA ligase
MMEPSYVAKRNFRFLRGLAAAGYRPWHKLMLLTETDRPGRRYLGRWSYASIGARAADNARAFRAYRPRILYGCATPLRLLAEQLESAGGPLPALQCVITTAEVLDTASRELLEKVLAAPVRDFYGLTEMGLVAWQARGADHYSVERNSIVTELIPLDEDSGRCRLLMTNLELFAAPLIRYDTGDIVITENGRIIGFEGRQLDVLTNSDGERISPYRITTAMQKLAGLRRFKLIETKIGSFALSVEADSDQHVSISRDATALLEELFGNEIKLDIQYMDRLIPEGTRKFRTIESHVPRKPA